MRISVILRPVQNITTPLLVAIPALPLLAGILCRGRSAATAGRLATTLAGASLIAALTQLASLLTQGPAEIRFASELTLRLDSITVTMALLVSFLGWVVLRFSRNYLQGDPHQSRFFSQMSFTLAAVLTLVLAGGFLVLAAAWVATSLCLHRLLLHFPHRPGAIFAARKKYVISRLGDACLLAALVVIHQHHGTWNFEVLFTAAAAGNTNGIPLACFLLAICAALKSAQFPFHGWLPDTMETPTPVSAFMHAGIINAGGFLIVRTSPLFVHAPAALAALAIIGTLTAAFGAVVMLVQPGVKRSLAYSTIAQMGFMILQCGVGAFGLALLHIVAHSLYKAHAFLHAGSSVGAVRRAAIPLRTPAVLAGMGLVAAGAAAIHLLNIPHGSQPLLFAWILGLALTYGMARAWSAGPMTAGKTVAAVIVAAGITGASLGLHIAVGWLFQGLPVYQTSLGLGMFVAVIFAGLFTFQCLMWRAASHPIGRRIHTHALNGFYIGTLGNRLLDRLWPHHPGA